MSSCIILKQLGLISKRNHQLKTNIEQFDKEDASIKSIKPLFQGFFKVDEYSIQHKLFNGGQSQVMTREIFNRGDAVVLMPYDPVNDTVVLQEQFRAGALHRKQSPWLLEFVAGMFGKNENPIDVAIREAEEEAGLTVSESQIEPICEYLSSPGGTNEYIHLFAANVNSKGVKGVFGLPEENEDILVHVISREQAMNLLNKGKIINAATIIGLQWLALNYQSLQKKWL